MKRVFILQAIVLVSLLAVQSFGHKGGTDARGGHYNRKTGGYHYHKAGRVHDANNPFQDHSECGICNTSRGESSKNKEEITAQEKEESPKEGYFVGSAKSNKFHNPSCVWANKIKPENRVKFETKSAAKDRGYVACKVCNP